MGNKIENKEKLPILHIGTYEDIPQEIRDNSDPVKVNSFFEGIATGSIMIDDDSLNRLLISDNASEK